MEGKNVDTFGAFFDGLGPDRCQKINAAWFQEVFEERAGGRGALPGVQEARLGPPLRPGRECVSLGSVMSADPGDRPPGPPKQPPAPSPPSPTGADGEQGAATRSEQPLASHPLVGHHAPVDYQPAQFPPRPVGAAAPYNPYGPPPYDPQAPPPPAGAPWPPPGPQAPGPPDPTAPGPGYPGAPGYPYGSIPPPANWPQMGYAPPPQLPFPGVGWFLLLVLMGFFGQIVVGAVAVVLLLAMKRPDITSGGTQNVLNQLPVAAFMGILFVASLAWPAVALAAARINRVLTRDTFRLRWPGVRASLLAVILGLALVPLALLLENLVARMLPRGDNVILQVMSREPGALALTLLGLTLVVCAPVGEELLFRGLGFRAIERRHGLGVGALVVSLIFAGVHLNVTGFGALFMVSMCLCWVTSKTDSLIPAMLLHAAYNGAQFLMLLGTEMTPEQARAASRSTDLGLPIWMIPVAVLVSLGCLALLARLGKGAPGAVD